MAKTWQSGRGKLGFMQPLLGYWEAEATTPMGPVRCTRRFERTLNSSYVQLDAKWFFGATPIKFEEPCGETTPQKGRVYQEIALIGLGAEGKVGFWSFTSDGKNSQGTVADASDIHAEAIAFEAQMPAGYARMVYWPDTAVSFYWVVESKTAKGWRRFVEHHYHSTEPGTAD